jgi:hypothetical protein
MTRLLARLLLLAAAPSVAAQVGNDPAHSPYRSQDQSLAISAMAGYMGGGGGSLGVGPHDGWMYGGRFQVRSNRAITLGASLMYGNMTRKVLDPDAPVGERDKGDFDQSIWMPQAIITLNVTGNKTWHRLAPFLGFAAGAAFGSSTPADSSGYEFGTKFAFAPFAGLRITPTSRIALRGEIQGNLWKLSYPVSFRRQNATGDVIIIDGTAAEWVMSPFYVFGLVVFF